MGHYRAAGTGRCQHLSVEVSGRLWNERGGEKKRTLESTVTVSFLSLHLPVDKPERVLLEEPDQQISVQ